MAKRRLEYALLLMAVLLFHIFLVNYLSFYLLLFFLLLPLVSLTALLWAGRKVTVHLGETAGAAQRGEPFPFGMTVDNAGRLSSGGISVRLEIQNQFTQTRQEETLFLPGNRGWWEVERTITSQHCGQLRCRILELRVYDYLGLFFLRSKMGSAVGAARVRRQRADRAGDTQPLYIPVLPRRQPVLSLLEAMREREATESLEERFSPYKGGDDPSEIFEIRQFRDGDRLSRVHWKLSGKLEQTMVKQYSQPLANRPLLLLELNGEQEELDGLMDSVLSISQQLLEEERPCILQWYDSPRQTIVRQEVEEQEGLAAAVAAVLSGGHSQSRSVVLEAFCSEGRFEGYSRILYLCAQAGEEELTLLCRSVPGQMVHILQVTAEQERQIAPALTASLEARLTLLHPDTLSEELKKFSL